MEGKVTMNERALFIRHTAKPGKRDEVRRIWERCDYVAGSDRQPAYFYCNDDNDPNTIVVFQLHAGEDSGTAFKQQPWYKDYERETEGLLAGPFEFGPQLRSG